MSHTIDHERMSQKQIITYYHVKIANHFMELAELHTTHWNEIDHHSMLMGWDISDDGEELNFRECKWMTMASQLFQLIGENMHELPKLFNSDDTVKIADWSHHYHQIAESLTEISYYIQTRRTDENPHGQNHDTNR